MNEEIARRSEEVIAIWSGMLKVGPFNVRCYVDADGRRFFDAADIAVLFSEHGNVTVDDFRGMTQWMGERGVPDSRPMIVHEVKTWPEWFQATRDGLKPFDVRIDDRDGGYAVGDRLWQREWNPETEVYTGRDGMFDITYVLHGDEEVLIPRGIEPGYVVLGLHPVPLSANG